MGYGGLWGREVTFLLVSNYIHTCRRKESDRWRRAQWKLPGDPPRFACMSTWVRILFFPQNINIKTRKFEVCVEFKWIYCWVLLQQRVTKRCRLSWLTNSALVYEPKCGWGRGGVGSKPMSTAVHRSHNKVWRSNSIFNLCSTSKGKYILYTIVMIIPGFTQNIRLRNVGQVIDFYNKMSNWAFISTVKLN